MKETRLTAMAIVVFATGLTSCVFNPNPVPEMPYRPRKIVRQPVAQTPQETPPVQTTTWETAPTPDTHITQAPSKPETTPVPPPPAAPQPVAHTAPVTPAALPSSLPTAEPKTPELPTPAPAQPTASPTPAQPTTATAADLKQITNDGPIPTATRVEGDPTRVWNPLDPSKTIRIINPKTNQPYPSGKKLKVRGTNFQFYVP